MPVPSAGDKGPSGSNPEEDVLNIGKPIRVFMIEPVVSPVPKRKRPLLPADWPATPQRPASTRPT